METFCEVNKTRPRWVGFLETECQKIFLASTCVWTKYKLNYSYLSKRESISCDTCENISPSMWFLILLRFGFWRVNQLVNLVMLKFHAGCCSYILRWNMKIYVDSRQSCGKFTGILILTPGFQIIKLVNFAQEVSKDNKKVARSDFDPKIFKNWIFRILFYL